MEACPVALDGNIENVAAIAVAFIFFSTVHDLCFITRMYTKRINDENGSFGKHQRVFRLSSYGDLFRSLSPGPRKSIYCLREI